MNKKAIASVIVLVILGLLVVSMPPSAVVSDTPAKAQFIIASWEYPDEYGQGIIKFQIYENSTGSWVKYGDDILNTDTGVIEWNSTASIKLRCWTYVNKTLTQTPTPQDAERVIQHSVSVRLSNGTIIFSQQNFTQFSSLDESYHLYIHGYDVVLNFIPELGQIYTVTVIYEVFW